MNAPKKIWVDEPDVFIKSVTHDDVLYIREDIVYELAEALSTAKYIFRVYQAHHEAKGDEKKAEANKGYAEQMEAALKLLEEE